MRRLRETDGTPIHLRAARFHMAKCATDEAIHTALRSEMSAHFNALRDKAREREDAETEAVEMMARAEIAEERVENAVRDIDGAAASADRASPGLNAQRTMFPDGFGAVIDPEGDAQIAALGPLRVRATPFMGVPAIAAAFGALETAEAGLRAAIEAEDEAEETVERLFAEELEARRAIRQQAEGAHGRLRDHYKTRPALAEKFFLNLGGAGRARKTERKAEKK